DERHRITRFLSRNELASADARTYFKTVNVYKLSKGFCKDRFIPFLSTYINLYGRNRYYEEVLRVLVFMGADELMALPVESKHWYEVDDVHDLDVAATLFADPADKPARFHERFGGYWRFGELKDFCYLANPYFPPARMIEEMRAALPVLMSSY